MEIKFPINTKCQTNGVGYWSSASKTLTHKKAEVCIYDWSLKDYKESGDNRDLYGELRVYFNKSSWSIKKDGLVYTDELWIKNFRAYLVSLGFTKVASKDVDYSEQGMQGDDYISLDIGTKFIKNFLKYKNLSLTDL